MSKILSFSANNQGIDYICSDIHGHFPLLEARMSAVNFDPRKDRVFSLGDLIDRGDESHRALEYLHYPWFHAILGNHELMLMRAYESADPEIYEWWYYWGGEWAKSLRQEQMQAYFDAFKALPVAIELSLRNGLKVGLVHAQLPSPVSWHNICDQLSRIPRQASNPDSYDVVKAGASSNDVAEMLWSKSQAYASEKERTNIRAVQDIDHVFHGHSIMYFKPDTITNRTFMDLGSYETGEIGFIDPVDYLNRVSQ